MVTKGIECRLEDGEVSLRFQDGTRDTVLLTVFQTSRVLRDSWRTSDCAAEFVLAVSSSHVQDWLQCVALLPERDDHLITVSDESLVRYVKVCLSDRAPWSWLPKIVRSNSFARSTHSSGLGPYPIMSPRQ